MPRKKALGFNDKTFTLFVSGATMMWYKFSCWIVYK